MQNPQVVKTGRNIKVDATKINSDFGITMRGHVDLLPMARSCDAWDQRKSASLVDLTLVLLNIFLAKMRFP